MCSCTLVLYYELSYRLTTDASIYGLVLRLHCSVTLSYTYYGVC